LRHDLLLRDLRGLGAAHVFERAPGVGMHLLEMRELPLDDLLRHAPHCLGDIREKPLFLARIEQVQERRHLAVVVIAVATIVTIGVARDGERRLGEAVVLGPAPPNEFGS
jgi:hypothetical protein